MQKRGTRSGCAVCVSDSSRACEKMQTRQLLIFGPFERLLQIHLRLIHRTLRIIVGLHS
jgi:hypothetical protein